MSLIGVKLHTKKKIKSASINVPCFKKNSETDLLSLPQKVSNLLMPVIIF